jgi:hypothetical protein
MRLRSTVRKFEAVLLVLFISLYIVAKIHFLTRFLRVPSPTFLREHSIIWAAMAVVAILLWLLDRMSVHQDRS